MLPPVLEIYVVWHPADTRGQEVAQQLSDHYHGTTFSGLIGGAVEVFVRSAGWHNSADSPRPIPFPDAPPPNGVLQAELIAVVPVLSNEFASVLQPVTGPWCSYATRIAAAQQKFPASVAVFPLLLDAGATDGTELGRIFGRFQRLATSAGGPSEPHAELRCRDLSQGLAQFAAGPGRQKLTVFISHTKRATLGEELEDVPDLIERVRKTIGQTRLQDFFDANDLQPGTDWQADLVANAATGALLALRTDLYASREWCQREMLTAKRAGMPVVILDALGRGEERGSFLMDHVPRIPVRRRAEGWNDSDIRHGLNLLVDESLKRALWRRQADLAKERPELRVAWWAPHAPEPATLVDWLMTNGRSLGQANGTGLRILHPDPPLGHEELTVLNEIAALSGLDHGVDIMTPRQLAARGG